MSWAQDPVARAKFDRNAVEIPRYASIEAAFERDIHSLIDAHQEGAISGQQLMRGFEKRLRDAQLDAFVAGRRAKGITGGSITNNEAAMLEARARHQMTFFKRFLGDMEEGAGRMPYFQRGSLYAKSLWSLFTRAESVNWDDPKANVRYYWILDVDAEHCLDCIRKAKQSRAGDGFSYDELITIGFPGDGLDRCRTNCRCHVRPVGKRVVTPERHPDHKATTPDAGISELQSVLGGEDLPLRLPVAGVPSVKLDPSVLEQSLSQSANGSRLARSLPLVPRLLVEPGQVIDVTDSLRQYLGYGLAATLSRDQAGLWTILALSLYDEAHKHREAA